MKCVQKKSLCFFRSSSDLFVPLQSFDDAARKLFQAHPVIKPAAAGASVTMEKTVIDIIEDDDEPQIMHL